MITIPPSVLQESEGKEKSTPIFLFFQNKFGKSTQTSGEGYKGSLCILKIDSDDKDGFSAGIALKMDTKAYQRHHQLVGPEMLEFWHKGEQHCREPGEQPVSA